MNRVKLHKLSSLGKEEEIIVDLDSVSVMIPFSGGKTEIWIGDRSLHVTENMQHFQKFYQYKKEVVESDPSKDSAEKVTLKLPEKKPGPVATQPVAKPPVRSGTTSSALG